MVSIPSAVRRVAQQIRGDILSSPPGQMLGSEDDLLTRYRVSRPTLRQAASLLAQEQLLIVKRGVGGGYFSRHPDTSGVAHSAAVYLMAHSTTIREILDAVGPIKGELAILASRNRDPELHAALREFAEADVPADENLYRAFLRSERAFSRILSLMAGNKVLALFLDTLYDFCAELPPEQDVYRNRPSRIREYWLARGEMIRAILAGDEEVAAIFAKRCAEMVTRWTPPEAGSMIQSIPSGMPANLEDPAPHVAAPLPIRPPARRGARSAGRGL
jgi:GntR family transcriptional repressor for pyruvate dehydrogenase complex